MKIKFKTYFVRKHNEQEFVSEMYPMNSGFQKQCQKYRSEINTHPTPKTVGEALPPIRGGLSGSNR